MSRESERLMLLIGTVSLLADFVYESFKSTLYLIVGAQGLVNTCLVDGLGELALSIARFSSPLILRLVRLSTLYLLGYVCTGLLIPAILDPRLSYILYPIERIGKGLRAPARDYLISRLPERPGKKFSICEALDQAGAVLGPLTMFILFTAIQDLRTIVIPLAAAYATCLIVISNIYGKYRQLETGHETGSSFIIVHKSGRIVLLILLMTAPFLFRVPLIMAQYLSSFRFYDSRLEGVLVFLVSTVFSVVFAYPVGRLVDKVRARAAVTVPIMCALTCINLARCPSRIVYLFTAGIVYGLMLSVCEIVPRAVINYVVHESSTRKLMYALFNAGMGATYFIGNLVAPVLYTYVADAKLLMFAMTIANTVLAFALFRLTSRLQ